MRDCQEGSVEHKDPRIRTIVNCCWNCKMMTISTDAEHEDGGGVPYCLMDGCDVNPVNLCKDWKEDN